MLEHHARGDTATTGRAIQRSQALAGDVQSGRIERRRNLIRQLVRNVVVGEEKLIINVEWAALCEMLDFPAHPTDDEVLTLQVTARLTRSGRAIRMVQQDGRPIRPTLDQTLVRLIVKARGWWQRLQQERGLAVSGLASHEGVTKSYVTRVLRLAFLSPEVVKSIMIGKQPVWMDSGSLSRSEAIALDWEQQKRTLLLGRAS